MHYLIQIFLNTDYHANIEIRGYQETWNSDNPRYSLLQNIQARIQHQSVIGKIEHQF